MALLNAFVTSRAQDTGAVDDGGALGTTWSVVGATSTVDVFTNTGLAATGGVPIYLVDGTLAAADNAALWSLGGTTLFDVNEFGNEATQGPGSWVHTGLESGGAAPITAVGAELDAANISHGGQDGGYNPWYGNGDTWAGGIDNGSVFAISDVIIPEPASMSLLALGGLGLLLRRRRS